jgi:hypothetical protein
MTDEIRMPSGTVEALEGDCKVVQLNDWVDHAVADRDGFESLLNGAGVQGVDLDSALKYRDELASASNDIAEHILANTRGEAKTYFPQRTNGDDKLISLTAQRASIKDAFMHHFFWQKDSTETVDAPLPILVISAPSVEGCLVTCSMETEQRRQYDWGMSIAGNGLSGSVSLTGSVKSTLKAPVGPPKVVFVMGRFSIERGRWTNGASDAFLLSGLDVTGSVPCTMDLDPAFVLRPGIQRQPFPFGRDSSGLLQTTEFAFSWSSKTGLKFGVQAFNVDFSFSPQTELKQTVTLGMALKAGYDYIARDLAEGHGVIWDPPVAGAVVRTS